MEIGQDKRAVNTPGAQPRAGASSGSLRFSNQQSPAHLPNVVFTRKPR